MLLFTLLFVLFTIEMHTQFGWWIFTWFKVHRRDTDEEQQLKKPKAPTSHLRCKFCSGLVNLETVCLSVCVM